MGLAVLARPLHSLTHPDHLGDDDDRQLAELGARPGAVT
jgi:hypothetical protein